MSEDEVRALIKRLSIEVKTTSNYTGGMSDDGLLYTNSHTVQLLLDDEVISEAYL